MNWQREKDILHKRRKEIVDKMRPGLMSRSQMMRGHDGDGNEDKQTARYDKWKEANQHNMNEWSSINKKFKEKGEEGKPMNMDMIRNNKVKYE